jgi:Flp pilus assembly protein TadD
MARADRRRAQRTRTHAVSRAGGGGRSAGSGVASQELFFPRLRKQAKWVFLFLALAFAGSFVLFDVGGSGYGGITDLLSQNVSGGSEELSESEARERLEANPRDAEALRALSTALQADGRIDEAIPPLNRYTLQRPADTDALRELAGLYLGKADRYRTEAQLIQLESAGDLSGLVFLPPSTTKLGEAYGQDPITEALSTRVNTRLNTVFTGLQTASNNAVATYKRLVKVLPEDSSVQLELAQAAEVGGDRTTALAAYRRFLELAPEDQNAGAIRERIKQLQSG